MSTKFRHLSAALSLCALALLPAAHAASKTAVAPMGMEDARYLLTRVGFSPSPSEIKQYAGLSREAAVDKLLAETHTKPQTAWPVEVGTYPDVAARRKMTEPERREAARLERQKRPELRAWWLGEMIATDSPLTERMTLFWHNHFVSSQAKVRAQSLMLDQNLTLRENAVGNFGQLLAATSKGPAMVIYLDAGKSKKTEPNENFAREVMELFSLGEGNYSERDIKEAARAFTGWSVNGRTGQFVDDAKQHDAGEKTIFGQRGNFNGDDVLRLILQRPETASFISKKLWLEFVSTNPTPAEMLNGISRRYSAMIPPEAAIGTAKKISRANRIDPKLV